MLLLSDESSECRVFQAGHSFDVRQTVSEDGFGITVSCYGDGVLDPEKERGADRIICSEQELTRYIRFSRNKAENGFSVTCSVFMDRESTGFLRERVVSSLLTASLRVTMMISENICGDKC